MIDNPNKVKATIAWMFWSMVTSGIHREKSALNMFASKDNSLWSSGFLNLRNGGTRYNEFIKVKIMLVFISLFTFKNLTDINTFKIRKHTKVIGKPIFKNQWLFAICGIDRMLASFEREYFYRAEQSESVFDYGCPVWWVFWIYRPGSERTAWFLWVAGALWYYK